MYTKIKFLVLAFLFGGTALASGAFVHVTDSVAGADLPVRISGLQSNENVALQLMRPDRTHILFEKTANLDGVVDTDILGFHVRKSGDYRLNLVRNTDKVTQDFSIFPGKISAYRSHIQLLNEAVTADGEHEARFQVMLRDAFDNPVPNKSVAIFSSRNEDIVTASKVSDQDGIVHGKVVSATPGISTLSAVTENIVLFQKPEVVFYLPDSDMTHVGAEDNPSGVGQYLKTQLFDDPDGGEAAYFSLENIKREATINENLTVKVVAKDDNGNVAQNYTGTIRFSSSDDRAQLPTDYRFTASDQGTHTFFLAINFKTPGSHTLAVHDLNDFRISGELSMSVTMGRNDEVEIPDNGETSLSILTPRPGTFRTSRVTITGETNGCETVKLTDGTFVLIDGLEVDQAGNFVFQTPTLADGVHQFKATCGEDAAVMSNEVSIKVDRTAPQNITVNVDPSGNLAKGQPFDVTVSADEPLAGASSVFLDVLTPHELEGENFVTTLTAPQECGDYPVDVTATDLLGNEKQFPEAAIIHVCGEGVGEDPWNGDGNGDGDGNGGDNSSRDTVAPTAVTNVTAESGEGKVTLFWSPARDNGAVQNYRVEFGCVPLDSGEEVVMDQFNNVPDNRTQWYVDGLSDTEKCTFQVIAIDEEGNESPASDTLQAVTLGAQANIHASAPQELEKSGTTSSAWPAVFAILAGLAVLVMARRKRL